jgi:hypothetical protein
MRRPYAVGLGLPLGDGVIAAQQARQIGDIFIINGNEAVNQRLEFAAAAKLWTLPRRRGRAGG